jgi:myo-inositol-1(or 4)-monophosphatase
MVDRENRRKKMVPSLSELEQIARAAGEILCDGFQNRPGYDREIQIDYKSVIDPVTEMDRRAEGFILAEIKGKYPHHHIISEESGEISGDENCSWYIDPLDGTINYAHGLPIFSISIGFELDRVMRLGVVYNPVLDECFSAELGKGAWLNGQPVRVSKTRDLRRSLLVTGFAYDRRTNPENNLAQFNRLALLVQGIRRLGSAALDLCYVAAGRLDGFWELRISQWDLAAGALIAREAGAVVTAADGSPDYFTPPCSVLVANQDLYPLILEAILNTAFT